MIFVLANDPHLARQWAEDQDVPADEWCFATAEKLKAHPAGQHVGETLIIVEGAENSPHYATILELAKDRGFEISSAPMGSRSHPA